MTRIDRSAEESRDMQVSPEEALLSTGGGRVSSLMMVVTDDWTLASVPHRSTPQRLLVTPGRVEICGSGVSGRRASDAAGRVWRTS